MKFITRQKPSQLEELDSGARQLLIRLNELSNSRKPVQRLPPDIVIEIATYLSPRTCGGDYQPLVAMSQVCRYWREALLSDTKNWSFISSDSIDLLPLSLERSGSHPLEIVFTTDTLLPHIIQYIGPHIGRLGALRCNFEEANVVALQTLSQLDHAPSLRTFSLKIGRPPDVAPELIEMALVLGEMPTLHTLELLPFPITPQFTGCKHLVDLRLDVKYSTLTSVLDLIWTNPSLERVRLLGNFENSEDTRAAGSITMKHLRSFTVERCTPCLFLEKLNFLHKTRVFIRYSFIFPHQEPFAYTLPRPMGRYPNLQGLSSLYALMTYPNDTYIDATGPNGSIAIQYADLQDGSALSNAIATLPTAGVTQLTCESYPAFTGVEIDSIVRMMGVLPSLEEITLVRFDSPDVQSFLSALANTNRWTNLRRLKFVHCLQAADCIRHLIGVAQVRVDESLRLDLVTAVFEEGEEVELFDVLGAFVGAVKLVKEEMGQMLRSEQVWDDANCTMTRVSMPMWDD